MEAQDEVTTSPSGPAPADPAVGIPPAPDARARKWVRTVGTAGASVFTLAMAVVQVRAPQQATALAVSAFVEAGFVVEGLRQESIAVKALGCHLRERVRWRRRIGPPQPHVASGRDFVRVASANALLTVLSGSVAVELVRLSVEKNPSLLVQGLTLLALFVHALLWFLSYDDRTRWKQAAGLRAIVDRSKPLGRSLLVFGRRVSSEDPEVPFLIVTGEPGTNDASHLAVFAVLAVLVIAPLAVLGAIAGSASDDAEEATSTSMLPGAVATPTVAAPGGDQVGGGATAEAPTPTTAPPTVAEPEDAPPEECGGKPMADQLLEAGVAPPTVEALVDERASRWPEVPCMTRVELADHAVVVWLDEEGALVRLPNERVARFDAREAEALAEVLRLLQNVDEPVSFGYGTYTLTHTAGGCGMVLDDDRGRVIYVEEPVLREVLSRVVAGGGFPWMVRDGNHYDMTPTRGGATGSAPQRLPTIAFDVIDGKVIASEGMAPTSTDLCPVDQREQLRLEALALATFHDANRADTGSAG